MNDLWFIGSKIVILNKQKPKKRKFSVNFPVQNEPPFVLYYEFYLQQVYEKFHWNKMEIIRSF